MTTPTPTVYHSRSRTTRKRLLIVAAVVVLVLAGWLIGRLQGGSPASGSALPPSAPAPATSAVPSPTEPSPTPPAAPTGVNAYANLQAESAAGKNGVEAQDTEDKDGGQNIGWVSNGDSLRFDDVNFGDTPATSLVARVASAVADGVNGRIEIRIDSATSPPVGTLPIGNTGGWQTWRSQATDITAVTGVHPVFLTFAADRGDDFLNLNYIKFTH